MYSIQVKCLMVAVVLSASVTTGEHAKDYDGATWSKRSFERDCDTGYSVTCFKLDIVSFLEKMTDAREYNIMSGISIVQDPTFNQSKNSEIVSDMARSFPNDPEKRLNGFLLAKVSNFLQSYTLNVKLTNPSEVAEARSAFEGRKKGKKHGMEGIIAAALMMKGMLMALALGAVALLAGKALMAALMALLLAGLAALKSLTSGGKQSTTYEIIAKPAYSNSHSHSASHENIHEHGGGGGGGGGGSGYGGYGRSLNFVLPEHLTKGGE